MRREQRLILGELPAVILSLEGNSERKEQGRGWRARYLTPLAIPYWLFSWQTYSISSSPGCASLD